MKWGEEEEEVEYNFGYAKYEMLGERPSEEYKRRLLLKSNWEKRRLIMKTETGNYQYMHGLEAGG